MSSRRSSIKWLLSQLPEWEAMGWVSVQGADSIREKYADELSPDVIQRRIFAVIAVLGAALIGGGVILLVAYNWETLGRGARVFLSFLPLLVSQLIALYVLLNKYDSAAWREACAMGVIAAIAASIALIGQTYNISGNLPGFLLTWLLLSLPTVLVLRATMSSFLLIGQFLFWMGEVNGLGPFVYEAWILLSLCLVVMTWLQLRDGRDKAFLNLLAGIAITVCLFSSLETNDGDGYILLAIPWLVVVHFTGFRFSNLTSGKVLLWMARIILLILLFSSSFDDFWRSFSSSSLRTVGFMEQPGDVLIVGLFYIISVILLVKMWRTNLAVRFVYIAPLITISCWYLSLYGRTELAAAIVSLYAIALGLALILPSLEEERTSRIQLGVGIICMTLLLKFFDYDMSLLSRGIAFIVAGGGFLGLNYWLSKSRKGGQQ